MSCEVSRAAVLVEEFVVSLNPAIRKSQDFLVSVIAIDVGSVQV